MEKENLDNQLLEYTPEGLQKLADYLTDFPEEQRMAMARLFATLIGNA